MREIKYKTFSLKFHKKNWQNRRPNVCQFELTFGCGLHCKHCYSDCYNRAQYVKRELNTKEVKFILDKVYDRGVIWLCFTGGDPLIRKDFLELYAYAKNKGFIITIFTNGYSMNKRIFSYLKDRPPFVIEITLNAASEDLYEHISRVKGSFVKAMQGINLILKASPPLKIKTQVTRDNFREIPKIKKFVKSLGLKFRPSVFLHSRLNGDLTPANLRISPQEVLHLNGNKRVPIDDCELLPQTAHRTPHTAIFRCAIAGGDGIHIDPYGNTFPCSCIRKPKINLLKEDIEAAQQKILNWVKTRYFTDNSQCQSCSIRDSCYSCPGKAGLETGDLEGRIGWFCDLAHLAEDRGAT
ncbi:MAG: radical SAM protein [Candidatus Omnitrophota bacterium]|nr:radical SAM protein [Candidatus Omnitrophota bacterium]